MELSNNEWRKEMNKQFAKEGIMVDLLMKLP